MPMACANLNTSLISYNMHGYNQGFQTTRDLRCSVEPSLVLLQEHWLTPANLYKFSENFPKYSSFDSSAMSSTVATGVLYGRPFEGVMTLVNKRLQNHTTIVCAAERYVAVTVGNLSIFNSLFSLCR